MPYGSRISLEQRLSRRAVVRTAAGAAAAGAGVLAAGRSGALARSLSAQGAKELDFTTFYTGPDGSIMQAIVDRYNAENADARINFAAPAWGADYITKLQTSAVSGEAPAIVALHNYEIPPLAQFLYEIDPAALGIERTNYVDVAWQLPLHENRLLGLTMSTGTMALYYNKDHFAEAGLDPEKPPTNLDEFIQAGKALTRDGRYGLVHEPTGPWSPFFTFNWQAGGELLAPDGKTALFDSEAAIAAAQLAQDLVHAHGIAYPEPAEEPMDILYGGIASMVFHGPWNLAQVLRFNDETGGNIGWAKYPLFFDTPAVASTSHIYSLMRKDPEDPLARDLGGRFIAWLLQNGSLEWARAQAPTNLAILDEMRSSTDPATQGMALWVEQASLAKFPPYHPAWPEVQRTLDEALQAVMYQKADVASTMAVVTAEANDILARD
ncbi:MAG: extracellular solute-binding protein [Chloroflexota bacterium]|nr:extracellular solute-binding protein [Chloroflexota bacterium]